MTYMREGIAIVDATPPRNKPYTDIDEAMRLRQELAHSISAQGKKLHRFLARDVAIDARLSVGGLAAGDAAAPPPSALRCGGCAVSKLLRDAGGLPFNCGSPLAILIRCGELTGIDMPDKWHIEDVSVYLEQFRLLQVRRSAGAEFSSWGLRCCGMRPGLCSPFADRIV